MSRKIVLLVALLLLGIFLLPSQYNVAYAAPGVDAAVWFYPKYDKLPVYPSTGQNTLQLWVSPVNWSATGIREVEIWVPKDVNNLALYRVREVHVALFNITNSTTGDGEWVLDAVNWTVSLTNIDANGNPTLIIASARDDNTDSLYNSSTLPSYFRMAVFELVVEYYRGNISDNLALNKWSVTVSGTDLSSKNFLVDHYVDNAAPTVALSSSTQSLLSKECLSSFEFNFTASIQDNSGLEGLNYSTWGVVYPDIFFGVPTGDVEDTLSYIIWYAPDSFKNSFTAPAFYLIAPFDGLPLPNSSTWGEDGYLWGVLVIIANDTLGNYTQMYPLVAENGGNSFKAYNPSTHTPGVDLSSAGPWLTGSSPSGNEYTVKFYVIAFDGTADYHWHSDFFIWTNYQGAIVNTAVTPITNNTVIDFMGSAFVDTYQHDLQNATLNDVTVTGSGTGYFSDSFGDFYTGEFTLEWAWSATEGPDPTFHHFRVVVWHEDSNTLVLNTTTTGFSVSFTVEDTGIGDYNLSIFVTDCGGESKKFLGTFTVHEFVIVWLNGELSKWSNYPDWVSVPQMGTVTVDIKTFGRAYDTPQQAVNVTVTEQYLNDSTVGVWTDIANESASLIGGTSTYGTWQFVIDVASDLNNNVSIYNVSATWFNSSDGSVIASNLDNTFTVKRVLFLDIWTDDSSYTTGETVTFFAHVYDLAGSGIDNVPISVLVTDPTGYLIASTAGYTIDGYVIPSNFGTIMFGTPIGDAWAVGIYSVSASAAVEDLVGMWFNGTDWLNVTAVTTMNASTTFSVESLRHKDLMNALSDLSTNLSSVSDRLDEVLSSLSSISDTLSGLSDSISQLETLINNLGSAISDLQNMVDSITSSLNAIDSKLDTMSSDISSQLTNMNTGINNKLDAISSTLSNVQSMLGNVATKSDVANVGNAVNTLGSNLNTLSTNLDSALGSLSSLLTATAVLVIITLIVAAVATFKVFKG